MYGRTDLASLFDLARVWPLTNGWQMVVRAEWMDMTPQRPHGLSYAWILQDERGNRLLGFDNSHAYDGAGPEEPFDHEHPAYHVDRRIKYEFKSAAILIQDAFDRIGTYCERNSVACEFCEEGL